MSSTVENISLPFSQVIDNNLNIGDEVVVRGKVKEDAKCFNINLQTNSDSASNIAFHFNPRQSEGQVVRNTMIEGKWGRPIKEERDVPDFPFGPKASFDIRIVCTASDNVVYVNGKLFCNYAHRVDLRSVSHVFVDGDAKFTDVGFAAFSEAITYRPIPGLMSGDQVRVNGSVVDNPERILINFQGTTPDDSSSSSDEGKRYTDIPLHFNPRWDQEDIILNTMTNDTWGTEEIYPLPQAFYPGGQFNVVINVRDADYEIFVNGEFLATYKHRIPSKTVRYIKLVGNAIYSSVKHIQGAYSVIDNSFLHK